LLWIGLKKCDRIKIQFYLTKRKRGGVSMNMKNKSVLKWRCAKSDKPPVFDGLGCSDCVLVIRDCGDGTLESYAISRYRPGGWGHDSQQKCYEWLDQGVNGYRVTKWCELPPSETQEVAREN
jgi:hypothetical protein